MALLLCSSHALTTVRKETYKVVLSFRFGVSREEAYGCNPAQHLASVHGVFDKGKGGFRYSHR